MNFIVTLIINLLCLNFLAAQLSGSEKVNISVLSTIEEAETIPGLQFQEFSALKEGLIDAWLELRQCRNIKITGNDQDVRPYFVALQAVIEHVLANELGDSIESLAGIIHTPMPATPLCNEGTISQDSVASSVAQNPPSLFTVKARTIIVREYLEKNGTLYIVYPQDGFSLRTPLEQQIYSNSLAKYPNLHDTPLTIDHIEPSLIGATYLFTDRQCGTFAFSIQMTQANSPQQNGEFALWYGEIEHPVIQERVSKVVQYVKTHANSCTDLSQLHLFCGSNILCKKLASKPSKRISSILSKIPSRNR